MPSKGVPTAEAALMLAAVASSSLRVGGAAAAPTAEGPLRRSSRPRTIFPERDGARLRRRAGAAERERGRAGQEKGNKRGEHGGGALHLWDART